MRVLVAAPEVHGPRSERIIGTTFHADAAPQLHHVLAQLRLARQHFRGRIPIGPFLLAMDCRTPGPDKAIRTDAHAIANGLSGVVDAVERFIAEHAKHNRTWHAVGKLMTALGWPMFEIDLGSVGSPFVHQTTVALRQKFDEAKRYAPALVVLEEIDAIASSRGPMTHDHKVEEVNEILRLVEGAAKNNILVIATTNRKEALDPALLRKGRFDHAIEVGYPTAEQVRGALTAMLRDRPHHNIQSIDQIASVLAGRPMSDSAWVVNEAARLAARGRKDAIDEIDLFSALKRLKAAREHPLHGSR
jgi:SpoVK/Ycf46/Vps4 family AAA+-type ATPase